MAIAAGPEYIANHSKMTDLERGVEEIIQQSSLSKSLEKQGGMGNNHQL